MQLTAKRRVLTASSAGPHAMLALSMLLGVKMRGVCAVLYTWRWNGMRERAGLGVGGEGGQADMAACCTVGATACAAHAPPAQCFSPARHTVRARTSSVHAPSLQRCS
jgi:hypothetical protein